MNVYDLKKRRRAMKEKAQAILDSQVDGDNIRALSPDMQAQFDAIKATVKTLDGQIADLEAMDTTEEDGEEVPAERSAAVPTRRARPIGEAPAVRTEERTYSFARALRCSLEKKADGLEGEVSQEIARRARKEPQGIFLPVESDPEIRALMYGKKAEQRDLTTTTGTGSVFVLPDLPFIELLRNKLVLKELGATFLMGMQGKFAIPRQNAASTAYWVAEGVSVTASNPTLDQVPFVDKTLGALVNMSRKFLYQTSIDAEAFVKNDLAKVLALEIDRAGINGSGSGAIPTGIMQNSTIQTNSAGLMPGTNGDAPTFAMLVAMESQVGGFNAERGRMAYLTSPKARGELKTTPKLGGTFPVYLWEDNELNG